ncbi:hypothetical protein yberc0001_36820 [Yersinia bercovieri ATCC 43970]|uniref:Uncharacterized protein n=1 Tax=Yersinia bercovieri ATCC 43970 TaxID=349968 RepID=A0ABP2E2A2_YERBE|nr:hypothetical protein yberc0001_36820 [Yersinia bercovieri ATCC 43970]
MIKSAMPMSGFMITDNFGVPFITFLIANRMMDFSKGI